MKTNARRLSLARIATLSCLCLCLVGIGAARAGTIDFENGTDGAVIASTIPGLEFTTTDGYDWIYGDWRTGEYNGPYPYGSYYSDGNFFAWLGTEQGSGIICFTAAYATYFQFDYSSESVLYLEAYDYTGSQLDQDSGPSNLDTGRMGTLRVEAPGMAYVMVHDTGNYWLVDNLDTDAITDCLEDSDCDDGEYCNGVETCQTYICVDGDPVVCADDGLWCDGTEFCNEEIDACDSTGDPCPEGEECDEENDQCLGPEEEEEDPVDDVEEEEEDLDVVGAGGCGCE